MIGSFDVGGAERQMAELIRGLPQDEFRAHLLVKSHTAYYLDEINPFLASFHSLDEASFGFADIWRFRKILCEIKPSLVHGFGSAPCHFAALSRLLGIPKFVIINGSLRDSPRESSLSLKLESKLLSLYDNVVANSRAGLRSYGQDGRIGRHVIYNGFDLTRIPSESHEDARSKLGFPAEKFVVTMAARLSARKDYRTFISTAAKLLSNNQQFLFNIAGEGECRAELESFSRSLNLGPEQVSFLGPCKNIEEVFLASDAVVNLSAPWHGEGIANVIAEAMACGRPVIASSGGGTDEIISDGINGFLIPCGDSTALAEKLLTLKNDASLRERLVKAARSSIEGKFGYSRMLEEYLTLYRKLLGGNKQNGVQKLKDEN